MKKQVEKNHYNFNDYLDKPRWNSYWHQINEVFISNPKDVLIIGIGDNIVKKIIESSEENIEIKTLDVADDLKPNYLGSITELTKVIDKKFDTILCCQVLEHIPFDYFEKCIKELSESVNKKCIISLPHQNFLFNFKFGIPKIRKHIQFRVPKFFKKYIFNGEHYWELGTRGYSVKKIEKILKKYFKIEKKYFVEENSYHIFFIMENKKI